MQKLSDRLKELILKLIWYFVALLVPFCTIGCKVAPGPRNEVQTLDQLVDIGTFSGSFADDMRLRDLLKQHGITAGLEGSRRYDVYVPASKAILACAILRTNELTLRGEVHLYKVAPESK
jgi:hypothetical protein